MGKDDFMYENRSRGSFLKILLTSLVTSAGVGVLLFFFMSGYVTKNLPQEQKQQQEQEQEQEQRQTPADVDQGVQTPQPQQLSANLAAGTPVAQTVASSASPGVVGLTVEKVKSTSLFDKDTTTQYGVGSGVIVASNGIIVTNHHVAGGKNKRIVVSLADGRNVDGTTLWSDPVLDLAVVKVNLTDLTTIPMGDSNSLKVGEQAIAIGNPLGLQFQRTVTSGIISALNRTIRIETEQGSNYMEDLIQTDASINPGNSGGPLLNSRGEVVGINTIKVTSAEAIGFAIPINVVKPIVAKVVDKGGFVEPYLGIFAYDKQVVPYIDGNMQIDKGVYVANVDENGPAAKMGIKVGCIIRQVDGNDVNTMMDLRTYMYTKQPGDTINVTHLMHESNKWVTTAIKLAAKEKDGLLTR